MAPPTASSRMLARVRTVENLVIAVAVVLAIPAAIALAMTTHEQAAGFLLLMLVGTAVPSAYERHWGEHYPTPRAAVAWTVAASAFGAAVFLGSFWLLGHLLGSGLASAGVAFVLVWGVVLLVESAQSR